MGGDWEGKCKAEVTNLVYKWLFGLPNEVTTSFRVHFWTCAGVVVREALSNRYEFVLDAALIVKQNKLQIKRSPSLSLTLIRALLTPALRISTPGFYLLFR